MKFENSLECAKSELDLFSVPPTQTSVEEGIWDVIQPHPNYDTSPVIRFDVPGNNLHYIDLASTELYLNCTIEPKFLATSCQTVVNNILHSMFEQVQVYLNNVPVENSNKTYPYRAYLENLLCYGDDAKKSFLSTNGFYMDTAKYFDNLSADTKTDPNDATKTVNNDELKRISNNDGAIKRRSLFTESSVTFTGKLHCDILNVNRYLLNNVDIKFVLTKASPNFYLMGDDIQNHKIIINETFLKVRRVSVSPTVMLAHAMALEKTTAKYPIKRVLVKQFVCPYKSSVFTLNGIHFGIMPTRVVMGIVSTDSFAGTTNSNPFNFKNFDVQHLTLKVNSKAIPYSSGLKLNWNKFLGFVEGYQSIFKNIREFGNGITPALYASGCSLFAFDLTPDLCSAEHYSLIRDGSLDLDVQMKSALTESVTFVFYLEFDNIIEITKERNILVDYKL